MVTLLVPLMAMAIPAKQSVDALLPMFFAGGLFAALHHRRCAQWGEVLKLGPEVAVGMVCHIYID